MIKKYESFESYLEDYFINEVREWNGSGITKDNAETGLENWLGQLDTAEVIELADKFAKQQYANGQLDTLQSLQSIVFTLKNEISNLLEDAEAIVNNAK